MSNWVYSINSIGFDNLIFFASKQAALNYAKKHDFCPKINGKYIIIKVNYKIAKDVRDEWQSHKSDCWYLSLIYVYYIIIYINM